MMMCMLKVVRWVVMRVLIWLRLMMLMVFLNSLVLVNELCFYVFVDSEVCVVGMWWVRFRMWFIVSLVVEMMLEVGVLMIMILVVVVVLMLMLLRLMLVWVMIFSFGVCVSVFLLMWVVEWIRMVFVFVSVVNSVLWLVLLMLWMLKLGLRVLIVVGESILVMSMMGFGIVDFLG